MSKQKFNDVKPLVTNYKWIEGNFNVSMKVDVIEGGKALRIQSGREILLSVQEARALKKWLEKALP